MLKKEIKRISFSAGEYKDIECSLPATAYSVLTERGLVTGTPVDIAEQSRNRKHFSDCVFKAVIEFSKAEASKKYIYLRLSGIVSRSEIIFNGRSYGVIGNINRVVLFNITDGVREGENTLLIESSDTSGRRHHLKNSGELSEEYDTAPYIYDAGIIGDIEVIISDSPKIGAVRAYHENADDGKVYVFVELDIIGDTDDIRAVASLVSPTGKIYFGGAYEGKIKISVSDPELWWPNGYGLPRLYKLGVTIYKDGEAKDSFERKIGLRRVELIPDEEGTPRLYVNGTKIFPRGAAYLPENSYLACRSSLETEKLIKMAAEANMNTLTVFDEGVLPSNHFYELCDQYGILVWQSLSVPYAAPPAAGVFAAGLYDAIDNTVEKLSSHPSVGVLFLSIVEADREHMRLFPDAVEEFRGVCLKIIDPVLKKFYNSVFIDNTDKLFSYDERYMEWDSKRARGVLYSVPEERTLRTFLPKEEYNIFSGVAERHTARRSHALDMLADTTLEMKFPCDMSEVVYATELSAANALASSVLEARCTVPGCASAALRPLNDGYYAISDSMIDYAKRKKAMLYALKDAYAPIAVSAIPCENKMSFYIRNDTKKAYVGKFLYALYDMNNKCWLENTLSVSVELGEIINVAEEDFEKYISGAAENYYVIYELFTPKGVTVSGTERFLPIKYMNFSNSEVKAEISGIGCNFTLKLTSPTYVTGVYVTFVGVETYLESNYVDILGGVPTVIDFETDSAISPEELRSSIRIKTPIDYAK
ncbi:MAG: hypothetical protein IJD79_03115 [Clostridia bacterium]|nr:hypothetical protein [Clostridia bacterium]